MSYFLAKERVVFNYDMGKWVVALLWCRGWWDITHFILFQIKKRDHYWCFNTFTSKSHLVSWLKTTEKIYVRDLSLAFMFNPKVHNHTWYRCENYTDNWYVWSFFRILTSCHNPTITESHFTQVWKLLTKFMCDLSPTFSPYV